MQVRARLASQVESGAFYEAQQTYKATFNRYKGKKDLANAYGILQVEICNILLYAKDCFSRDLVSKEDLSRGESPEPAEESCNQGTAAGWHSAAAEIQATDLWLRAVSRTLSGSHLAPTLHVDFICI